MPRFGDDERRFDRFAVAQLAHEHDVGVLPQNVMNRAMKTRRVGADFALIDEALAILVNVFDGVFDGDDVFFVVSIDVVDHRRERRRFARPRRPSDEHEPARELGKLAQNRRQRQLLERSNAIGNVSERAGDRSTLNKNVTTESPDVVDAKREVEFVFGVESLPLFVVEQAQAQGARLRRRQHIGLDGQENAVDAQFRRRIRRYVQIARILADHQRKQLVHHCTNLFHGCCLKLLNLLSFTL